MARQGYRVWAARLAIGSFLLFGIAGVSIRFLWQEYAVEPSVLNIDSGPQNISDDTQVPASHPLDPLLVFAKNALRNHVENHQDYTAVLIKRERVDGKLLPESKMALKLKYGKRSDAESTRPVSVYLKTIEPKSQAGREVIWVQGRNDNKITAREAGLLGIIPLELRPDSRLAMMGNRYPITDIGIEKLLCKLIEKGERDRKLGFTTIRTTENATLGDRQCRLMEVIHESPTTSIDGQTIEFEFFLAQIFIDEERSLPLRYASYGWPKMPGGPPELFEEYTYQDLVLNVGLQAADFDPKNPAYGF